MCPHAWIFHRIKTFPKKSVEIWWFTEIRYLLMMIKNSIGNLQLLLVIYFYWLNFMNLTNIVCIWSKYYKRVEIFLFYTIFCWFKMTKTSSSSLQLLIFFFAQIVFFADFQNIILYFRVFSETFNVEYISMGFLISIFSIFTLFSPIFGSLSDLYGRKGFLLLGLILFT